MIPVISAALPATCVSVLLTDGSRDVCLVVNADAVVDRALIPAGALS